MSGLQLLPTIALPEDNRQYSGKHTLVGFFHIIKMKLAPIAGGSNAPGCSEYEFGLVSVAETSLLQNGVIIGSDPPGPNFADAPIEAFAERIPQACPRCRGIAQEG